MIALGDMRLHWIDDCHVLNDAGGAFGLVPRALWRDIMPPDAENRIAMAHHALLVQHAGRNILIDVGYGDKMLEKMRTALSLERRRGGVPGALDRLGVLPEDIHIVIDTHLHNDHCGGNTRLDADGQIVAVYSNADYIVGAREFHDATHPNERTRATYLVENFVPLYERQQLRLIDEDTEVAPGVRMVSTPGHTPGHMSVLLESGGESALFVSDMASFAVHFERLAWMTAYDVEPLVTLETKRRWQRWALETNALLFFVHDPTRPVGRYAIGDDGKGHVLPVETAFA
ncbi:MAG: MBL fold metallo-hydrolase [Chloroflexota bacterium]|nr:MBL fold metallo-hydrolase [Chloroflexota bacterium]